MTSSKLYLKLLSITGFILLCSCQGAKIENNDEDLMTPEEKRDAHIGKLFGDKGFVFGGSDDERRQDEPGSTIGVNAYLWRASLDTLSFMPLKAVDPFGGVILTDWYTSVHTPNERIKVDIRILDRQLRVDGIKVSIFRQKYEHGTWVDVTVHTATARQLEDAILMRAREMKVNTGR